MVTTNHLGLTLLEASQAQKEVTVNTSLVAIDAMLGGVLDKDISTPPGTPSDGDMYIVAAAATDDWTGQEDALAYYAFGSWRFITPGTGVQIWVADEGVNYVYNGSAWQKAPGLPREIIAVTGTTKTLALTDANTRQESQSGSATTLTIPTNSSVAFSVGTEIEFIQQGAGLLTISGDSGVTLNGSVSGSKSSAGQYTGLYAYQRATDDWIVT